MSDEVAKDLTKAIYLLMDRLSEKQWISSYEVLELIGKGFTKTTAHRHLKVMRLTGKIKEYRKVGRDYMYNKEEILKLYI